MKAHWMREEVGAQTWGGQREKKKKREQQQQHRDAETKSQKKEYCQVRFILKYRSLEQECVCASRAIAFPSSSYPLSHFKERQKVGKTKKRKRNPIEKE